MKTAMQELIDEIDNMHVDENGSIYLSDLKEKAKILLEKEKHHFICYSLGYLEVHQFVHPDEFYNTFINFEETTTFNTNE
jgi:hypothetical protein